MVKRILLIALLCILGLYAAGQNNDFGLRLGAGPDRSGEVALSWHKALGKQRLELNLGWATCDKWDYPNVSVSYQWHWAITGGLCWYVGPSINMGWYVRDGNFGLGAGAQIGMEYNFDFPIQLSIDIFPRWNFLGATEAQGLGGSGGLSVRYRFGGPRPEKHPVVEE